MRLDARQVGFQPSALLAQLIALLALLLQVSQALLGGQIGLMPSARGRHLVLSCLGFLELEALALEQGFVCRERHLRLLHAAGQIAHPRLGLVEGEQFLSGTLDLRLQSYGALLQPGYRLGQGL